MSAVTDRKALQKLESSDLWQQSQKVAKLLYGLNDHLPDDERMSIGYRLKSSAFNLTSDVAEAIGAINYRDAEYSLSMARKDAFSLKNAYRFLGVQKITTIDPDVMLQLDEIVAQIDAEVSIAWKRIDQQTAESPIL